jgi:hypothetical protein
MTNEEETVFANAAAQKSAAARSAYLDDACAGNDALRLQVEALLREHDRPRGVLESPLANLAPTSAPPPSAERVGSAVVPYRLLEQIGGGGMGLVYQLAPLLHPLPAEFNPPQDSWCEWSLEDAFLSAVIRIFSMKNRSSGVRACALGRSPALSRKPRKERAMNCFSFGSRAALSVLAMLALASTVTAGEQLPFKGTLQGDVTRTGAPPVITVNISAAGNATQLGQFAVSIPHSVTVATKTATGAYLFVAANGDTLTATFTGASAPLPTDPTVLAIVENATITGGTGRFEGATGSFTAERLYDTIAGTTTGTFEGSVSSPGAAKH